MVNSDEEAAIALSVSNALTEALLSFKKKESGPSMVSTS